VRARLRIQNVLLDHIRLDLHRPHRFAYERVGFLTAGAATVSDDELLLVARDYKPVADEDYVPDPTVGVKIGPEAMRKAAQFAYRARSTLLHVHSHGGRGRPDFSGVDLRSGAEFVPGFFHSVARMPHGMLVLSDDSATGLLWLGPDDRGAYLVEFVGVGAPVRKFGRRP
jgi:hypothetical protein